MKIGALEAGGTKMVMGIFTEGGEILARKTLPTLSPDETVPQMRTFFEEHQVDSLGVGGFGPLDVNPDSPTYGSITTTPKLAWRNFPLLSALCGERNISVAIDTDVNAAALAECEFGAAKGLSSVVYITVGTGVGGGVCIQGMPVHGMLHPEVGHMLMPRHPQDPLTKGICPYHDNCLEGYASGPALGARSKGDARLLSDDDPLFKFEAYYLAQMCVNLIMTVSPQRILLGGGVMQREILYPMVRHETMRLLGNYIQHPLLADELETYITAPALFPDSGLVGAYLLGLRASK